MTPEVQNWATFASIAVSFVAVTVTVLTYLHSRNEFREKQRAERREAIVSKLNDFYGPLLAYRHVSRSLHRLLTHGKPKSFRTLTFLLDRDHEFALEPEEDLYNGRVRFRENDEALLKEIIEVSEKIESHIVARCGLIDDETLTFKATDDKKAPKHLQDSGLLSALLTHIRVLRMAYDGKLTNQVDRFKEFVFPDNFDDTLIKKVRELQSELRTLSGGPAKSSTAPSRTSAPVS